VRWHSRTDRNVDARINTANDSSRSGKNFGELWISNSCVLQARFRWAGYTLGSATLFWFVNAAAIAGDCAVRARSSTISEQSVHPAPGELVTRGWRVPSRVAIRATGTTAGWIRAAAVDGTPSPAPGLDGAAASTAVEAWRRRPEVGTVTATSTTTCRAAADRRMTAAVHRPTPTNIEIKWYATTTCRIPVQQVGTFPY